MKKNKFLVIAIAMLIFVSCKKNDLQDMSLNQDTPTSIESPAENSSRAIFSSWQPINTWNNDKKDNVTKYTGTISEPAITSDIAHTGLVLLFVKAGTSIESLPYTKGNIEWYYQITAGNIFVTANTSATSSINKNQSFSYIILSKDQLSSLEAKGTTKSQLMNLNYQNAVSLLQ